MYRGGASCVCDTERSDILAAAGEVVENWAVLWPAARDCLSAEERN